MTQVSAVCAERQLEKSHQLTHAITQAQVAHFVPMVAEKINQGPSPVAVAEAVQSVLENEQAPIATPVGTEAEAFLPQAKALSPEDFEQHIKHTFNFA
ncbi:hypothetical protein [Thalassomonas sp. RHCl1]|uniref:hypothetical protein n=1 Tax=Thalassomonas sp. RHCl1 TaxID=2995320 RepID=UPI00248C82DA|nr:hypothetical protein [Thalassomonas sp. RHCl1]